MNWSIIDWIVKAAIDTFRFEWKWSYVTDWVRTWGRLTEVDMKEVRFQCEKGGRQSSAKSSLDMNTKIPIGMCKYSCQDMYILGIRRYIYTCKEDSGWQTRNENNNNKYKSAHWAVYRGAPMSTKNRRRSTDLDFTGINVAITIIKKRVISPKISFFCSICTRYVGNSGSASGQGI